MTYRNRKLNVEEDAQSNILAPLASMYDLMIALLALFVATTAITFTQLREAQLKLAKMQPPQPPPHGRSFEHAGQPEQVWGLNLKEFERRQLAIRVHSIWNRAFRELPGALEPSEGTIAVQLPDMAAGNDPASIDRSISEAKKAIAATFGTKWQDYAQEAGCRLEVDSGVSLSVSVSSQSDWVRFEQALEALDAYTRENFNSHVEGTSEVRRGGSRLLINFRLQNELRKRLAHRFQSGPGTGVSDRNTLDNKMRCD